MGTRVLMSLARRIGQSPRTATKEQLQLAYQRLLQSDRPEDRTLRLTIQVHLDSHYLSEKCHDK